MSGGAPSAAKGRGGPLAELARALGTAPPAGLAALPPETIDDIVALLRDARARQADALRTSTDAALKVAPRPLRPALRKVLTG